MERREDTGAIRAGPLRQVATETRETVRDQPIHELCAGCRLWTTRGAPLRCPGSSAPIRKRSGKGALKNPSVAADCRGSQGLESAWISPTSNPLPAEGATASHSCSSWSVDLNTGGDQRPRASRQATTPSVPPPHPSRALPGSKQQCTPRRRAPPPQCAHSSTSTSNTRRSSSAPGPRRPPAREMERRSEERAPRGGPYFPASIRIRARSSTMRCRSPGATPALPSRIDRTRSSSPDTSTS